MGMTVRGKYADIFWFTLFHEIHHILSGHMNGSDEINIEEKEKLADIYARDTLIPFSEFARFLESNCFSNECIIEFAKQINISPSIIVGRLQKDNIIPFNHMNDLRTKYPT
jgi:HTH-type transcriptional regulator/antitoxin HigA